MIKIKRNYTLSYEQTFEERYETGMNESVRDLIRSFDPLVEYVGEAGGTNFATETSDQSFYVATDEVTAERLHAMMSQLLGGRPVDLSLDPDPL